MICPSCGAASTGTKFCENCGCPMPVESAQTIPVDGQPTAPVAESTAPIGQPAETSAAPGFASVPGDSAWQAQPQQAYQVGQTQQMPPQQSAGGYVPPQQNAGSYVPPSAGPQPPYQPAPKTNQAPSAAFVLVIVGLVLSVLFITFVPGLVCSIIGLVLNAGYNKKGLNNPRKTATNVIGVIGIVAAVLSLVFTIFITIFAAQVVDEIDRQGIDVTANSVHVSTDSSGNVNISVKDSSQSASAASSAASSASSAASSSAASAASSTAASSAAVTVYEGEKYHDTNWNPTLYSIVELTGAELSDLLAHYNFYWDDEYVGWTATDGSLYSVSTASGNLSQSQVKALPKGAAGQSVALALWVEGYDTPDAAFKSLTKDIVVEEKYVVDNETVCAIVYGSPLVRYLVVTTKYDDGEQLFMLFTDESISSGYFSELFNAKAGSSIKDVWKAITSGENVIS